MGAFPVTWHTRAMGYTYYLFKDSHQV